ncbi:ABC transporter ATP-binding protein [Clostridium gasigenes]|uniref:ABC transporter ATP-binding protein n=1 Tax=Clostridium gasigenes TaxID=94869 RepID=UPI0014382E67|nr:ABC transporter ATP-binding protein [Clostridium gasigenes]NKF07313.1 ABC transporter ATP-binding protein [Clostridium gasigenes]QSW18288.1 ABC transporter ATP-binding protein [Clostridium gasigenes]
MDIIIETKNLTKSYGKSRGIIDVNLTVEQGEIFGFIGPNGAGKSTTIRTLLSLINKTSGEAKIFGLDCEKDKVQILKEVGYLPSEVFYYENMKAKDLLNYSASFYGKDCSARIKELSEALELDLNKKIEDMSLGNKKKVGIVQGLLHSPKLIILDEPTSGLDPLMQKKFFEIIKKENERGATVLFSSHILSEVQKICDRVAIIKEGRIIKTEKISDLKQSAYKKVTFNITDEAPKELNISGSKNVEINGQNIAFLYKGNINSLLDEIGKFQLTNIDITEPSLEEIFMHYYEA